MTKKIIIRLLFYFHVIFIFSHEKKFFLVTTFGNTRKIIKEKLGYLDISRFTLLKFIGRNPADIGGLLVGYNI